jgi:hydrogenase maturation factor
MAVPEPECITCGDVAWRMRVVEMDEPGALAVCLDEGGRRHTVDTGILGAAAPGEMLLVHAGTALGRVQG